MKVVSLFSGAGGLDLGFKMAGHDIIWANDLYGDAVETYRLNLGDHIVISHDIISKHRCQYCYDYRCRNGYDQRIFERVQKIHLGKRLYKVIKRKTFDRV